MKKFLKLGLAALMIFGLVVGVGCAKKESAANETNGGKTYIFASDTSYAPFEYQEVDGKYAGFDIDLIAAVAKEAGINYEVKSLNFDGVLGAVESKTVDGAISAMTITDDRKKKFNFSTPYFDANQSIAVRNDNNDITNQSSLEGKTIGVQIGTTGAKYAGTIKGANVKTFNNITEAFMDLVNGGVDAVINDIPVTSDYIAKQGKDKVKIVSEINTGEQYGIAVAKGNDELLTKLNKGLEKVKANGTYDKLYQKWFPKK